MNKSTGIIQCALCDESFNNHTAQSRSRHFYSHHTDLRLVCAFCNRSFDKHQSLVEHKATVHSITVASKDNHVCGTCHQQFTTMGSLFQHLEIVHDNFKWFCVVCDQQFKRYRHLEAHSEIHNDDDDDDDSERNNDKNSLNISSSNDLPSTSSSSSTSSPISI
jgi:hypothetical protein